MSFYQKHRPQKFTDLIGQTLVVETVLAQLKGGKTVQAYLFIGHKGTGKTTTARLLAKSLLCDRPEDGEPCGKCDGCLAVASGSHLDVLEIDAASNRGIEEIRDLREKIKLAPTQGKMKIYIIDEVHMLTMEAFNALLKTLEEPPAHAVFVLCTTDAHKVPATILSRCQRFEFNQAGEDELVRLVERTAEEEGLKVDKEAASAIAASSDGSYRDALSLMEQLGVGGAVTFEQVAQVSGIRSAEILSQLIKVKDTAGALSSFSEAMGSGVNISRLNESMLRDWRRDLLIAVESKDSAKQAHLSRLLRVFSQAQAELRTAVLPSLPIELAIIEATTAEFSVAEVVVQQEAPAKVGIKGETTKKTEDIPEVKVVEMVEEAGSVEDLQELKDNWDKVLKAVKPLNHSLEAFLRGCEACNVSNRSVTLRFFYKFHKDMVDQAKNRKLVEEELGKLLGREVRLKTTLGEKPQSSRRIKFEDVQNVEEVASEDLAQKAVDIFNAGIS